MFFYARADTHFLLYIYDNMRNELIDRTNAEIPEENRIEQVLQKSKETSLLRYERVPYNSENGRGPGGWYPLLVKTPALLNNEQFAVFRAVHGWRDRVARTDDDSPAFVMPQHVVFSIAKLIPTDMIALLGIAHPVSHGVKSRAGELLALIKSAKAEGKQGPSMMDVLRPDSVGATANANTPDFTAKNSKTAQEPFVAIVDEGELRSENSTFWGGAFGSSIWDGPTPTKNGDGLRLAVPMPALSSEIYAASNGFASSSPDVPVEEEVPFIPLQQPTPVQKEEEAFIVKRGGKKRKSDAISDPEEEDTPNKTARDGQTDNSIFPTDLEEAKAAEEKAARKKERRAEKRRAKRAAKRAAKEGEEVEAEDDDDSMNIDVDVDVDVEDEEEPFDYSKAEPVMHGKRASGDKDGKKGKKPFDPYAKSADAPKGMRRLQTERPGKSHTFKN
jgi:exosome complex exonuclease RRP6